MMTEVDGIVNDVWHFEWHAEIRNKVIVFLLSLLVPNSVFDEKHEGE